VAAGRGHAVRPSSSLVPGDDPTLLFTNAGMVQFKKVFLGQEPPPEGNRRATTSQKCVRAGGKHNDLEQVGHTARHHTFFEMLGNFSFGDYFKRDAIRFAWEFVTKDLGIPTEHIRVTVYKDDDEARQLWVKETGIAASRVYGLGEKDNFWQMADTGPCGPCTEIYIDLAHMAKDFAFPAGASGEWTDTTRTEFSQDAFVEGAEAGRFLEIWNLVFMQFDRQTDGTLVPLPKPSVDTGAGLERIAAVLQGVANNYHTDLFAPLLETVARIVGKPYAYASADSASYRVLADHARAVSFLLADGVFPSNEGRGYVLRRILRRAVRHAWLLGRRQPTLVHVVEQVIAGMQGQFPELEQRRQHILDTTKAEEERFLATIEGGLTRFEELTPAGKHGTITGEDAFKLYDTFGFPIDLTELMAPSAATRWTWRVRRGARRAAQAVAGRSQGAEADGRGGRAAGPRGLGDGQGRRARGGVRRLRDDRGRVARDRGEDPRGRPGGGDAARVAVLRRVGRPGERPGRDRRHRLARGCAGGAQAGRACRRDRHGEGTPKFEMVKARVPSDRRHDTERNHTATHLLHAALRQVLGEHVHQAGSLVAPDRLRFDFTHHGPIKAEALDRIEQLVNEGIWANVDVTTREKPYQEAIASGAMALFGEKYGDVVRVVEIPGLSVELCGGTHVRNTGQIALLRIVSESGVAAGVRRIEAVTGPRAFQFLADRERALLHVASKLKVPMTGTTSGMEQIEKKLDALIDERKQLEKRLDEAMRSGATGGGLAQQLVASASDVSGTRFVVSRVDVSDIKSLQALGDAVREALGSGVALLGASLADGKGALLAVSTDDARDRGLRADLLVRDVAATVGGRGGGKPHMAQAGIEASQLDAALAAGSDVLARLSLGA
jgi:alanyl-tRNA synthetase